MSNSSQEGPPDIKPGDVEKLKKMVNGAPPAQLNPKGLERTMLETVKEGFLHMCEQYAGMGNILKLHAKCLQHPLFASNSARDTFDVLCKQFHEIGEQLKVVGRDLDTMGGAPVLEAESPQQPQVKPPKKKE